MREIQRNLPQGAMQRMQRWHGGRPRALRFPACRAPGARSVVPQMCAFWRASATDLRRAHARRKCACMVLYVLCLRQAGLCMIDRFAPYVCLTVLPRLHVAHSRNTQWRGVARGAARGCCTCTVAARAQLLHMHSCCTCTVAARAQLLHVLGFKVNRV